VTVPALVFCCLYASGLLGTVAPKSWHPPEVSQAQLASHARQAAQAARAKSATRARLALAAQLKSLGKAPGPRNFGVAISGNDLHRWYAGPPHGKKYEGTGVHPQMLMTFQSWHGKPMPTTYLKQDEEFGIQDQMFTWEPWHTPPRADSSPAEQERAQPRYSNQAIADGNWDSYIKDWADALNNFPQITVYIRFGHEMNGDWYPWSLNPPEYVLAWRHIWNIFHQQHVTNAKFVWSADFGEGAADGAWWQNLMAYWPGKKYVNDIGTTVINFGGTDSHAVDQFTPLINLVHQQLKMPMMLTEVNTARQGRAQWMLDLASYVGQTPWIKAVVLSQAPSHGKAAMPTVGNLSWQVWADKSARARQAFKDLVAAATREIGPSGTSDGTGSGA
jgi:mannan endo-1,4-beta-mannosidase